MCSNIVSYSVKLVRDRTEVWCFKTNGHEYFIDDEYEIQRLVANAKNKIDLYWQRKFGICSVDIYFLRSLNKVKAYPLLGYDFALPEKYNQIMQILKQRENGCGISCSKNNSIWQYTLLPTMDENLEESCKISRTRSPGILISPPSLQNLSAVAFIKHPKFFDYTVDANIFKTLIEIPCMNSINLSGGKYKNRIKISIKTIFQERIYSDFLLQHNIIFVNENVRHFLVADMNLYCSCMQGIISSECMCLYNLNPLESNKCIVCDTAVHSNNVHTSKIIEINGHYNFCEFLK